MMQAGFKCDSYSCFWKPTVSDSPPQQQQQLTSLFRSTILLCNICLQTHSSKTLRSSIVYLCHLLATWLTMELSNCFLCLMFGMRFLLVFFSLVRWFRIRTWRLSTWITNRKQVSLPVTSMHKSNKQVLEATSVQTLKIQLSRMWGLYTVLQESVNCGFN